MVATRLMDAPPKNAKEMGLSFMRKIFTSKKTRLEQPFRTKAFPVDFARTMFGARSPKTQKLRVAIQVIAGAHLFAEGDAQNTRSDQGWITSTCHSPHVGRSIGLGFLENGDQRLNEVIVAANPLEGSSAHLRVVPAHFVDPEGGRLRD